MKSRRMVRVAITGELINDFIIEGSGKVCIEVLNGIPKDAQFVASTMDAASGIVYFFFVHPSFDEVSPGAIPPVKAITIRTCVK